LNAQGRAIADSSLYQTPADNGSAKKRRASWWERTRYAVACTVLPFKFHVPPNGATPAEAVTAFLGAMTGNAGRGAVIWQKMLESALDECGMDYDARYEFFQRTPIEDYYFAAIVAMEAVHIRTLYAPLLANALLSEIGGQIDVAAGRRDRMMSEMVFTVMGRIAISQGPGFQKKPYDVAVKSVLQQLGFDKSPGTAEFMNDKGFRHALGEPLAVGFRNWWAAFQAQFELYLPPEPEAPDEDDELPPPSSGTPSVKRPWRPRRAKSF
jgi:hypothetical protein